MQQTTWIHIHAQLSQGQPGWHPVCVSKTLPASGSASSTAAASISIPKPSGYKAHRKLGDSSWWAVRRTGENLL